MADGAPGGFAMGDPDRAAYMVYTSGTSGHPKGALVSHGRHLAAAWNLVAHYPILNEPGLRTVVYLPLCHVIGRDIAVTLPLLGGLVPHYGESVEDLPRTLFEVAPDVLFTAGAVGIVLLFSIAVSAAV